MLLITRNEKKIKEFSLLLKGAKYRVQKAEYPELRSNNPQEIVEMSSKALAEKFKQAVFVEDSGLFIEELKGFPGTCTRYADERIGNSGIVQLMKGKKNRKCFYKSAIGYCEPGKKPVSFLGVEEGTVSQTIRGNKGWGQDSIFIPKGEKRTYGEIRKEGDVNIFRKNAAVKFKKFLATRNN